MAGGEEDAFASLHGDFEMLVALVANPLGNIVAIDGREAGDGEEDASDGAEDAVDDGFAFLRRFFRQGHSEIGGATRRRRGTARSRMFA